MPSKPRSARSAASSKKPAAKTTSVRTAKARRSPVPRKSAAPARASKLRGTGRAAKPTNGQRSVAPTPRLSAKPPAKTAAKRVAKTPTKPATKPTSRPAAKPAAKPAARSGVLPNRLGVASAVPSGPSTHDLAMQVFERGVRALQTRSFKEAASNLASIIDRYPDEKELHERARVYLSICERQFDTKRDQGPHTLEERMNAATVAINRGAFSQALDLLRSVKSEDGDNDAVYYMLAVAHAGLGDPDSAVSHLHDAIELNPDNRFLAAQDSDLEALRQHAAFVALLDSPPPPRRRTATRVRSTR